MIRTMSSEMSLDHTHLTNKTNRVPYMGCQSLLYQTKITKETAFRYHKSVSNTMEDISNIPTSILIHQINPQSIPSFSTYHSSDSIYNFRSLENNTEKYNESNSSIYDYPPWENKPFNGAERRNPCRASQSVRIRKKPSKLNLQSIGCSTFNTTDENNPSPIQGSINVSEETKNNSNTIEKSSQLTNSSPTPRPNSYQTMYSWNDFISAFSTNGSKNIYWTRRSLKQPILNYVKKNLGKNAVKAFKIIQKYMGDRRTRKSPSQLFALLQKSFSYNDVLRDEILIQICRQTINNPDSRSSCRGWELLSECLLQFSPSEKLMPYLDDFISSSLNHEMRRNESELNACLANLRKCQYHLSWSLKSYKEDSNDAAETSLVTTCNHRRKRSLSESNQNGLNKLVIYSPQNLSGLMKQQSLSFPFEEVPIELVIICNQIAEDIERSESFLALYRTFIDPKMVKKVSVCLEKWFNLACQKGSHLVDWKSVPNLQSMALHVLIYWFESLSQPIISQQMAFLSNFSISNLAKINKRVLVYLVNFFQKNVIYKSKDNLRNIASFLCSLIFQLPKDKFYPLDNSKDSVYMNIILPVFQKYL